ncbi:MAG: pyruvate, phosphate dikinase [Deltaproteobacteria bacterium GWC2_42_11]|nr:MAG: pyruvate, phosphate dikinase [Deltaproteobacteria bacterium GWC2_42_11]HBO84379.1 pyruvate, phosphate dikinase [Deltaproteobacteria bacterium]
MPSKKHVYFFGGGHAEGNAKMKDLLGGKGSGVAEMTNAGVPVPPGFTITTEVCKIFYENKNKLPKEILDEIDENLKKLEGTIGKRFGNSEDPLLVSVRSGSKFSMPGMMDTVLNLGLNDKSIIGLIKKTGNERFAWDAYRRFIQMFGNVVLGIEKEHFEHIVSHKKQERNIKLDIEFTVDDLKDIVSKHKAKVKELTGKDFPQEPYSQLEMSRDAVFKSWNNPRAVTYRRLYSIPDNLGTAVNVQTMVFGNLGNTSATGVGFTRNPATGENEFYGEYLMNAQGEDVVAGIRTPHPIKDLEKEMPDVYKQLKGITLNLEKHYRDVQDFEFTIQEGKLYMLQTRNGKRTGIAAVKIAVDMVTEGLITKEEAVMRVEPEQIEQYLFPIFNPKEEVKYKSLAAGLPAGPGDAAGAIVFTANKAVEEKAKGKRVILVRMETSPDDIHGMHAAQGFLTARGGMTSHAAVVARQMGKVCVAGCGAVIVNEKEGCIKIGEAMFKESDYISVSGFTGKVYAGDIPTIPSEVIQVIDGAMDAEKSERYRYFSRLLKWADEHRKLKVRANADIPRDAHIAREFGAEGIGLCRTEHMFFAEDRLPIMQEMILATTVKDRETALSKLLPMQKSDFKGLFQKMKGYPVTIRLLDPPLHEFLPKREELLVEIAVMKATKNNPEKLFEKERLLKRVEELHEFNPMLGHRGCRLGITYPEITKMQVRAIIEAACELAKEGQTVIPEIMIPLVGNVNEIKNQKALAAAVADEVMKEREVKVEYMIGTMIEVPRAAITADEIASEAEFFSFGTNDLTQTTFGFSRDDSMKFVKYYIDNRILENDPFAILDQKGVGEFIKMAVEKGKKTRPNLKVGICGEHGGEPSSVEFCHRVGLNYVSCSPYRVPIARLAAAHAALKEK